MVAYGGDEVNALVLDIGSTSTRAGYAGEDTPRIMCSTSVGYNVETKKYYIGDNHVNKFKPNMEIKSPLKQGLIEDWEAIEKIWSSVFYDMLRINPEHHPLLVTEPAWNTPEHREKTIELAFETFQFPAFYLAPDAVMTAFSAGRGTALVLDSGGEITSAVPVYDGFVLKKGILYQPLGGNTLSEKIKQHLYHDLNYTITPQYKIKKKQPVDQDQPPQVELYELDGVTESFNDYQISRVLNEFKETIHQVSEVTFDESHLSSRSSKYFEFPDGFNHSFGLECYKTPEILFQPNIESKLPEDENEESENRESDPMDSSDRYLGVHEMVYSSINHCDIDLRPLLFNNVVVTGGNTLLNGFNERLNYELPLKAPGSKIKIHASGNTTERKSSSWLGGSILASLGTFHQLWISKREYEEFGSSIVHRKC